MQMAFCESLCSFLVFRSHILVNALFHAEHENVLILTMVELLIVEVSSHFTRTKIFKINNFM